MKKIFVTNMLFTEAFHRLAGERNINPVAKAAMLKNRKRIAEETNLLFEIQKGLQESVCERNEDGTPMMRKLALPPPAGFKPGEVDPQYVEDFVLRPEKEAEVKEKMAPLLDQDLPLETIAYGELGPNSLSSLELEVLVEAGLIILQEKKQ